MVSATFPKYFNPQELGNSLKEVATDVIQSSGQEVVSRWFHSTKDADLFIWSDRQRNILKQQLSYYGQVVEWNIVEGVKTGFVIEQENDQRVSGSEILRFDVKPQTATIEQALRLLECITALPDDERKVLMGNFCQLAGSNALSPEEFVARFGSYLQRPPVGGLALGETWWSRLMNRLSRWFKS